MASTVNIANADLTSTFDVWRIRTNLTSNDVNEICRGEFTKPVGNVKIEVGYLQLAASSGQTLRVNADAGVSGTLSIKKLEQDGVGSYIISDTGDVRFNNTASIIQFAGNTYTVKLFNNNISTLANTYNSGWLAIGGIHSNNSLVLNVNNYLTVGNAARLGNVTISSNVAISKNVAITGNVSISSRANITGTVNIGSTLEVAGNTRISSNLVVSQNASITGNVSIGSRANVVGSLNVGSTLEVAGNTTIAANLTVSNAITAHSFRTMDGLANSNIGLAGTRRIYYFPKASYSAAKLLIEVQSNDVSFSPNTPATQISEGVVAHVNDNAYMTIYGTVSSPPSSSLGSSLLGTFSAGVVGSNVEIYLTTSYNNCLTKVAADLIN